MKQKMIKLWNKYVNRETVSYLICGVLTTVINYIANYIAFYRLHMKTLPANTVAWIVAVIFAFFANKIFVFKSKIWHGKQFWHELYTFTLARLLSLGFDDLFMYVTVDCCHIENNIAKLFSNVFVVVMNYFASKFLIFKKKENPDAENKH